MKGIETMEIKISKFLRGGVILSGTLIFLGWITGLDFEADVFGRLRSYETVSLEHSLTFHHSQQGWAVLLSYAGLAVLISLPLIRVFLTGLLFIRQKEYTLALTAGIVMLLLLLSFTFGIQH